MASVIAVGHGATISFSNFTASVRSIGGFTQEREAVDAGHLSMDSYTKKVPAGLVEPGSFECEFIYDPNAITNVVGYNIPDPTEGTSEMIVTFPIGSNGTAAKVTANAFVTSWTSPELTSDGLMTGTVTFQWEGEGTDAFVWSPAVES